MRHENDNHTDELTVPILQLMHGNVRVWYAHLRNVGFQRGVSDERIQELLGLKRDPDRDGQSYEEARHAIQQELEPEGDWINAALRVREFCHMARLHYFQQLRPWDETLKTEQDPRQYILQALTEEPNEMKLWASKAALRRFEQNLGLSSQHSW